MHDCPVITLTSLGESWLRGLTASPISQLMIAQVLDNSMSPTMLERDLAVIDRGQSVLAGQDRIWAVAINGREMIRRIRSRADRRLQIAADDRAIAIITTRIDDATILGRVVGVIRPV